ncbi:hypothetical protein E4U55_003151 [Claviceps digitariae]|nr:hypothetical protein E4U55_003151 [Claviceps digitariae]
MVLLRRLLCIAAVVLVCDGRSGVEERARSKVFDLTISWERHAPDGFAREMLLVNGQSPGPTLEVEQDEWVVVRVCNKSPFETSVHFHGIDMQNTPWSDGVPGVTQRAIAPGRRFTYRFRATHYGSYWYHSHAQSQIEDGFYGPIIVHPRRGLPQPFHLISQTPAAVRAMRRAERHVRPLVLHDFMHLTSEQRMEITPRAGIETSCYDAILFNGKGRVTCLGEEVLRAQVAGAQRTALDMVPGERLTDKGCLPPIVIAALGDRTTILNASALPAGSFLGCKPSHGHRGQMEVIKAPRPPGRNSWMAIDIVGAFNSISGVVAIDDHDMWVYAMDGLYIQPQRVQAVAVANGERYSVMVKLRRGGRFKVRCHSTSAPQTITGYAILRVPEGQDEEEDEDNNKGGQEEEQEMEILYTEEGQTNKKEMEEQDEEYENEENENAHPLHKQWINLRGQPLSPDVVFFNQTRAHPFPPEQMAPTADALHVLNMRRVNGRSYLWALNSTSLRPTELERLDPPLLLLDTEARADASQANANNNVTIVTRNGTWVDLVFRAAHQLMPAHPIHKHGVKMFLLGSGTGPFPWTSVEQAARERPGQFNLVDPPRRDGVLSVPVGSGQESWMAVRYQVSNPGPWLLHCHIGNHMMGGMMMVILDGVDAWPEVPREYQLR